MSREGITSSLDTEEIANFLVNDAYPPDVHPLSCVLTGSQAYGLATKESDYDYVGIHLMDTIDILEHPDFRPNLQVIRRKFDKDFEEVSTLEKGGYVSLDSFELWKFIELVLKGSFVVYEILYLPEIHHDNNFSPLMQLFREALNSKIGHAARGNALHDWKRDKKNLKKTIMAYFRLLQAIHFLREQDFAWNAEQLFEYGGEKVVTGTECLKIYQQNRKYQMKDEEVTKIVSEIDNLLWEADRAMVVTQFPEQSPKDVLEKILKYIKQVRSSWI